MSRDREPQVWMAHPHIADSSEGGQELVSESALWNDGRRRGSQRDDARRSGSWHSVLGEATRGEKTLLS